ncbi:MAG: GAP family protein [Verrucomicrobiota bacterium]
MLLDAIGESLPMAVGAALSPLPVAAGVSILLSARPGNAFPFLVGWVAGIIVVSLVVFKIPGLETARGDPAAAAGWVRVVFGGALLVMAGRKFKRRPAADVAVEPPKVLAGLDTNGFGKSIVLGFVFSAINPKNLILTFGGAASIHAKADTPAHMATALVVYTLIASASVIFPIVGYYGFARKVRPALRSLKDWLVHHHQAVGVVLLIVFGALLIGNGLEILAEY